MADFCKECWHETWHAGATLEALHDGFNDFKDHCQVGFSAFQICEGCGPGMFDHTGERVKPHVITDKEQAEIDAYLDAQLEGAKLEADWMDGEEVK